ncbi:MAG: GrpB family protein, partial [Tannerella sp.]|nr:GrpB family protein [Tannerella sp.]
MTSEINDLDNLTAEQVGKLFPIRIVEYNPDWQALFEREKALLARVLGENVAINIEHIGSTSVAGLAAKPTIDILMEVSNLNLATKQFITEKLQTAGYGNMRNAEKENAMTFGKGYDIHFLDTQTYHV